MLRYGSCWENGRERKQNVVVYGKVAYIAVKARVASMRDTSACLCRLPATSCSQPGFYHCSERCDNLLEHLACRQQKLREGHFLGRSIGALLASWLPHSFINSFSHPLTHTFVHAFLPSSIHQQCPDCGELADEAIQKTH